MSDREKYLISLLVSTFGYMLESGCTKEQLDELILLHDKLNHTQTNGPLLEDVKLIVEGANDIMSN